MQDTDLNKKDISIIFNRIHSNLDSLKINLYQLQKKIHVYYFSCVQDSVDVIQNSLEAVTHCRNIIIKENLVEWFNKNLQEVIIKIITYIKLINIIASSQDKTGSSLISIFINISEKLKSCQIESGQFS